MIEIINLAPDPSRKYEEEWKIAIAAAESQAFARQEIEEMLKRVNALRNNILEFSVEEISLNKRRKRIHSFYIEKGSNPRALKARNKARILKYFLEVYAATGDENLLTKIRALQNGQEHTTQDPNRDSDITDGI